MDRNIVIIYFLKFYIEVCCIWFYLRIYNYNLFCLRVELYGCCKGEFSRYVKIIYLIKLVIFWLLFDLFWFKELFILLIVDIF